MNRSPKTRQAFLNFSSTMFKVPFSVILGFISMPLLLKWLGDDRLGMMKVLLESVAYMGLLDFGMSMALPTVLAKVCGEEKTEEIKKVVQVSILAYFKILPLILLSSIGLFFLLTKMVQIPANLSSEVLWCFVLIVVSFLFFPLNPFRVLLEVKQRADIVNWIILGQFVIMTILNLVFAKIGFGLVGQGIAYLLAVIFSYSLFYVFAIRYLSRPFHDLLKATKGKDIEERLWKSRGKSILLQVFNLLGLCTDNLVVGVILAPKMVVPFILTQKLALTIQNQLNGVGNSVWASLVDLFHKGEFDNFRSKILEINKIIVIVGMAAMVSIATFNRPFLALWVGETYYGGALLNYGVCAFVIFNSILSFWGMILVGTGNLSQLVTPTIVGSLINVAVSIFLTIKIGIAGPILGSLTAFAFTVPWNVLVLNRHRFQISLRRSFWSIFPAFAIGGIIIYLMQKIIDQAILPMSWFTIPFYMISLSGSTLLLFYFVLLNKSEKNIWWRRIKGGIRK